MLQAAQFHFGERPPEDLSGLSPSSYLAFLSFVHQPSKTHLFEHEHPPAAREPTPVR